ncbi:MAG: cobalamin-dependent protein, partial [Catalinimonas sp.]
MAAPTTTDSEVYLLQYPVRIVTAASLFDGHDAAINLMRRILQSSGAEVIHLGHNRSVAEIVDCAIQEDAQAIAVTSYQGGHVEFFKYMYDLLRERGAGHVKIFGGGGGTILPREIDELHAYGIDRIYSPDDGRAMGLQGMINDLLRRADFPTKTPAQLNGEVDKLRERAPKAVAQLITVAENHGEAFAGVREVLEAQIERATRVAPVLGVTGTGGAGKSSLVDELVRRFLLDFDDRTLAVISVDPSRRRSGGALLGDRIRMNALHPPEGQRQRVYMRSLATRQRNLALSRHVQDAIDVCRAAGYDLIIVESSGIGQSDTAIVDHCDVALYVMTADYGAATQLEKIDMLDYADLIAINKFDKRGALDALRDVRKQYQRNRQLWDQDPELLPVFGTIASQFMDPGTNQLYRRLMDVLVEKTGAAHLQSGFEAGGARSEKVYVIPPERTRYLAEIVEQSRAYDRFVREQTALAQQLYQLRGTLELLRADADRAGQEG